MLRGLLHPNESFALSASTNASAVSSVRPDPFMACHSLGLKTKNQEIKLGSPSITESVLQRCLKELWDRMGRHLLPPIVLWLNLHPAPSRPAQVPRWARVLEGQGLAAPGGASAKLFYWMLFKVFPETSVRFLSSSIV